MKERGSLIALLYVGTTRRLVWVKYERADPRGIHEKPIQEREKSTQWRFPYNRTLKKKRTNRSREEKG